MADTSGTIFINLLLLSLFVITIPISSSSPASIHINHKKGYQLLDVSNSLKQALQVFSPQNTTFKPLSTTLNNVENSSENALSFTLHPRRPSSRHHKNYTSLTLARLARDSARVDSIISRHGLHLSGLTNSDLNPMDALIQPEKLQSPVTSGATQGSGEYFVRVGLGQPVKETSMVIDTGSDVSWLQCQPCTDCYQQSGPIYNPSGSSTYKQLPCDSAQCTSLEVSACHTDTCLYQVSYGDGSYTVGDFATETVSFGGGSVADVALGCGHDNEGLFVGAGGLLGLGGGKLSLPSQIKATSFSYCLVNRDSISSSTLEFNSGQPGDSVLAPLLKNSLISTYYFVGLTGFSVGGRPVNILPSVFQIGGDSKGGVIVDSGTAVTRLRAEAYNSLRDAFVALARNLPTAAGGFALFDTCFDLSSMTTVSVPTVSFLFESNKTLRLRPTNYMIPVDNAGKYCFAFAPTSGPLSIIGNVQQQGIRVSYDLSNKYVGFSPNKC